MVEKPNNNQINKFCDYLVTNNLEENSTFHLVFGLFLLEILQQILVKVFILNNNSNLYYHHSKYFKIYILLKYIQNNKSLKNIL